PRNAANAFGFADREPHQRARATLGCAHGSVLPGSGDSRARAAAVGRATIRAAVLVDVHTGLQVGDLVKPVNLSVGPFARGDPVDGCNVERDAGAVQERLTVQWQATRAALADRPVELDRIGPLRGAVVA